MKRIRISTSLFMFLCLIASTSVAASENNVGFPDLSPGAVETEQDTAQWSHLPEKAGMVVTGKGGNGGGGGGNGGGGNGGGGNITTRIAFRQLVESGKGRNKVRELHVIAAGPDGGDPVQVTATGTGDHTPLAWSDDGWMATANEGTIRILDVPTSDPSSATEITNFSAIAGTGAWAKWSAHADSSGNVLPASQQFLAFQQANGGTSNIVAVRHDGSGLLNVTNHSSTCIPSTNPGCSGNRYNTSLFGWLPTDASAQTLRVLYGLRTRTYAGGALTGESMTYRVAELDASTWPAPTLAGDDLLLFGGASVTASNLTVSRDGTMAAYDENLGAPTENHLNVAPIEYNAATGTTTLRSDLAGIRADASGTNYTVSYAGGFSPDKAQIVIRGWNSSAQFDVYVADATANGAPTEVDNSDEQSDSPIWGP